MADPRRGRQTVLAYVEHEWFPNHVMEATTRESEGGGSYSRSILRSPCVGVHHSTTSIVPFPLRWVCTTSAMSA